MKNWTEILDWVQQNFNKATPYIEKVAPLFQQGKAIADDIEALAKFIGENIESIKILGPDNLRNLIEAIQGNKANNVYLEIVKSLTVDELLAFQKGSVDKLKEVNSTRLSQLNMLKKLSEIPQQIMALARLAIL